MSSGSGDRDEDAALRARLDKLSGALKSRAKAPAPPTPPAGGPRPESAQSAMSLGMRAASEFVAAVIVGAAIGWAADRLFGTSPFFLIVFFFIGVVAGVWNVIRATSPKRGSSALNSPLSPAEAPDKDGRRAALGADPATSREGREASGGARQPLDGADDDED